MRSLRADIGLLRVRVRHRARGAFTRGPSLGPMATDSFTAVLARPRIGAVARAVVLSRLLVWSAGVLAVLVGGMSSRAADFDPAGILTPYGQPLDTLVAPGARWDSVWYLAVAHTGYGSDPARPAFFPVYPL